MYTQERARRNRVDVRTGRVPHVLISIRMQGDGGTPPSERGQ